MKSKTMLTGVVMVTVMLSGCTGIIGGGSGPGGGGGGQQASWCNKGAFSGYTSQYTSGQQGSYTYEVKGVVNKDGRQVCKSVINYKNSQSGLGKIVYYTSKDGNYFLYETYGPNGKKMASYNFSSGGFGGQGG